MNRPKSDCCTDLSSLDDSQLKLEILRLTAEYSRRTHGQNRPAADPTPPRFIPGQTTVPYAGRVFDEKEVVAAVDSTLDFWLTLGQHGEELQRRLAQTLGVRRSLLVNSGSSANLVALATLTSPKIPKERRIEPGDEVITVAAGFPTTISPIVQNGAVPVFIDADPVTGNADCSQLEAAYRPGKTKAVMMAHALGNPFDIAATLAFCQSHDLWLIEDNCDALGCTYSIPAGHRLQTIDPKMARGKDGRLTKGSGSWGDLSTQSFYPPHHLTMGEGGAVSIIRQAALGPIAESFRDWGRDCWCPSGKDNTCNKRFGWQLGELPEGYDHKYIYSHLGYNLKPLDPQAAIGLAQMEKLPSFIQARVDNWQRLRAGLDDLSEHLEFALPTHATAWNPDGSFQWDDTGCQTHCSWFGFKISTRPDSPVQRTDLAKHLDAAKVGNRMLFGGNLTRQPALADLRQRRPGAVRIVGDLAGADRIMNHTLFIGTYPGLTHGMIDYMIDVIHDYVHSAVHAPTSSAVG